ncbi:MAG: hypothetical protein FJY81_05375 [Candidatus Aminicenantes bacterium]|nr:hypothetical protein [Candidatus Aminicenantes bacterium]
MVYYYLKEKPGKDVTLEFLDAGGRLIRKLSSADKPAEEEGERPGRMSGRGTPPLPAEAGLNRFVWNMRYPDAERVPGAILWAGLTAGPVAVPGIYQAKLTVDGEAMTRTWEWKKDPRLETSQEEFEEQFDFLLQIRDKLSEVNQTVIRLREVRQKIERLAREIKSLDKSAPVIEEGKKILAGLTAIEEVLIQSRSKSNQDPLNYPIKLDNKIAALAGVVAGADARQTDQSRELFKELAAAADAEIARFQSILEKDVPGLNAMLKEAGIPHIFIQ